jgi:hypothetical protein
VTVLEKCRDYCKRISSSEDNYKELLGRVWINPNVRNKECSHPEVLCENCELNRFIRKV